MHVQIKPDGSELIDTRHELSHVLPPMIGREGLDPNFASKGGGNGIQSVEGKAVRIIQNSYQYTDMSIHKED